MYFWICFENRIPLWRIWIFAFPLNRGNVIRFVSGTHQRSAAFFPAHQIWTGTCVTDFRQKSVYNSSVKRARLSTETPPGPLNMHCFCNVKLGHHSFVVTWKGRVFGIRVSTYIYKYIYRFTPCSRGVNSRRTDEFGNDAFLTACRRRECCIKANHKRCTMRHDLGHHHVVAKTTSAAKHRAPRVHGRRSAPLLLPRR